jgi:serine phosphatase RsbU (regulator of sigma subunit)
VGQPQARAGIPISVKLVIATSFVIAGAIGTATWFSTTTIGDLTSEQIKERKTAGEAAIARESNLIARAVADAIRIPLGNTQINDVNAQLDRQLGGDLGRLQWLVVTTACKDCVGQVAAASNPAIAADKTVADDKRLAFAATLDLKSFRAKLADGQKVGSISYANLTGADWVYGMPILVGRSVIGELWMGITTKELEAQLEAAIASAEKLAKEKRTRMLMVSALVLAIGIVLAALQGIQLARPIKTLTAQAHRIGSGDLSTRAPENRRDELGVLARTFNVMQDAISSLLHQQAQKASLEKEMELARQVQQAMLPPATLDQHGTLKIVGYCQPASSCGGDWWTYRKLSNGRMLLVVGDATGHGIHSAMIAATARGAVEALSAIDERLLTPEQVLRAIDSAIRQVGEHNVIMTAFAAVFDSTNGILHYANAGQNFPYVIKLDGPTRILGDASIIAASGNPLGDRNIAVEIRRGSLQLKPGDLFVCFTDGVVERSNRAGKLFGARRLRSTLSGQALPDAPALLRLRDSLVHTLESYAEGVLAEDDITFVLCQYDPPAARSSAGRGAA